jgi:hypothetical protein
MSEVAVKPRSTRALSATLDQHAEIAAQALEGLEKLHQTRLHNNFPLLNLRPSLNNPRRAELDKAGVSLEWVEKLKLRDGEDIRRWTDRLDEYLESRKETLEPESLKLLEEIFGLSHSILKSGLLQPITTSPDNEIQMGECRWTACLLCNRLHDQVIVREFAPNILKAIRFLENDKRSALSTAATVQSVRLIIQDLIGGKCGFDNEDININLIRDTFGAKTTKSAYYLSFCRLPEGDELLTRIYSGAYRGIRSAYEDCVKRIEVLKAQQGMHSSGDRLPTPHGKKATKQASVFTSKYPPVKTRLPGTNGGKSLFQALAGLDGIPADAKTTFEQALRSWEAAPDNVRKNIFAKAMNEFFALADPENSPEDSDGIRYGEV